jgi:hypothetical protein
MKEFDKILKEKLIDIDSPYPSETWSNIKKGLPKKKRRPYGIYLLIFAFLSVGSLAAIKFWSSSTYPKFQQSPNQKTIVTQTSPVLALNSSVEDSNQSSVTGYTQPLNQYQNQLFAPSKTTVEQDTKKELAVQTVQNTEGQDLKTNMILTKNTAENNGQDVSKDNFSFTPSLTEMKNGEINYYADLSNQNSEIQRTSLVMLENITLPSTGRVFGTDQSHLFELVQMSMKKNASLPCPTFVKKQNLSFIEFYFSNDYGIRDLSMKHEEQNGYLNKRNNTEFPFFSYSAGTRFGIGWESGIAFKSGLNYTQINEKFIYTDPNSIQKKTITLLKYIYDSNFNVIDSIKTTEEVEIPGSNTIVNYNKYRFIDIPVLFQYTIAGRKRLSYSLTFGPYINISFAQSGKILSEDNKLLLDISERQLYKENIGISLYTAISINYQLTKNTQIVFEPNFRYIPNTIAQLQNPLDQKYLIASIAAGFRYKI